VERIKNILGTSWYTPSCKKMKMIWKGIASETPVLLSSQSLELPYHGRER
jgi:hypothetical protein